MPFVPMMFDGGRHQPRADTEYPTDSGSNDSRTLRGSCDISHAASQSGALELMFDIPDDLSYTFVSEAAGDYPPTEGLGK
jgi:hypothetical protein